MFNLGDILTSNGKSTNIYQITKVERVGLDDNIYYDLKDSNRIYPQIHHQRISNFHVVDITNKKPRYKTGDILEYLGRNPTYYIKILRVRAKNFSFFYDGVYINVINHKEYQHFYDFEENQELKTYKLKKRIGHKLTGIFK